MARQTRMETKELPVSQDEYASFIGQIQLTEIWMREAVVKNLHGPETPDEVSVHIVQSTSRETVDGGFIATHRYDIEFETPDSRAAELSVAFCLSFESAMPVTDELFEVFGHVNLPLNTWPYLREFLGSSISRMNWMPFTLPALKRGIGQASRRAKPPAKRATTRKRSLENSADAE